jgi:hypothetical protein
MCGSGVAVRSSSIGMSRICQAIRGPPRSRVRIVRAAAMPPPALSPMTPIRSVDTQLRCVLVQPAQRCVGVLERSRVGVRGAAAPSAARPGHRPVPAAVAKISTGQRRALSAVLLGTALAARAHEQINAFGAIGVCRTLRTIRTGLAWRERWALQNDDGRPQLHLARVLLRREDAGGRPPACVLGHPGPADGAGIGTSCGFSEEPESST